MPIEKDLFWKRLESINAGMLGTRAQLKLVPMSHYADRDAGALWFITAQGTDLVAEVEGGAQPALHIVGDAAGKLWTRMEGHLELSPDRGKLDEIWNRVAAAWFDEGKDDPDLRLLRLDLSEAEI
ncbi:pyridoxamine 5'-phosphate oxidase family protein [Paracoccus litorisediminis]|uniref:pyridoxamine 5'-phosphate oxidase family protein n=1 Tax=Paracoccus litorisediminis TaxID=2006130 RepID=UPI001FEB786A|nr:pyridoxamine 5'-phosphate oxidase family protein [Paracoccus litorisediminis]